MNLWKIAWRSIQQRALESSLTGLSMALGVALVVTVLVIHSAVDNFFRHSSRGYDMIVGATKGGKMQLVLNTVYHLSQPVENVPYRYYKEFLPDGKQAGRFAKYVDVAVPVCLGDSFEKFRVVGTTPAMFEAWAPYQVYEFADGRNFKQENFFEGVIGSVVAHDTKLKVGDTFQPTHGIENTEGAHKHDAFKIVGVLKPTGTPNDRALFINMEGFYLLRGHASEEAPGEANGHESTAHESTGHEAETDDHAAEHHGEHAADEHHADDADDEHHSEHAAEDHETEHDADDEHEHADDEHPDDEHAHDEHAEHEHEADEHAHDEHGDHEHGADDHDHAHSHTALPESQREVTAILVRSKNAFVIERLRRMINKGNEAQAVMPAYEVTVLMETFIDPMRMLLLVLAVLIVVVAGIGIMVAIYSSMSDRRRDIAIMRSLGARRSTVLAVILLESILLSVGGGLLGWLLGHSLIALAGPWVLAETGFALGSALFTWQEMVLLPGLVVLASLVGFLPALAAYRTDVAKALTAI
jgi:putative ABC transport system permease protein